MNGKSIEQRVYEVLHNVNWLLDAHESYAELVEVRGNQVVLRCVGPCYNCDTDCVGTAFRERMPEIELIYFKGSL